MPVKRRKIVRKETEKDYSSSIDQSSFSTEEKQEEPRKKFPYFLLIFAIFILGFLLYKNKDLIIAGTLDGKPVFVWELDNRLRQRYGKQILDEMMSEKLVLDEANKKGITTSETEMTAKISEIEKGLGNGAKLTDVLKQQGLTMDDFKKQVKLRILVDKMVGGNVKVSQKEIDDFMEQNKDNLESFAGTDSAKQRKYAEDSLKQQKTSEEFDKWFTALKAKANISIFIK